MKKILILLALTSYSSKAFTFESKVNLSTKDDATVHNEQMQSKSNGDSESSKLEKSQTIEKDSHKNASTSSEKAEAGNSKLKEMEASNGKTHLNDSDLSLNPYRSYKRNKYRKYPSNSGSETQEGLGSSLLIGGGLILTAAVAGAVYYRYGSNSASPSDHQNFEKIGGEDKLPKIPVTDPNYSSRYIGNTVSVDRYADGWSHRSRSYRKALLRDGVQRVTRVRGDGNCGFYSIYLAGKLLENSSIDESTISEEVERMKNFVKERAIRELDILEGDELDELKLKMSRAVAQELLEQMIGSNSSEARTIIESLQYNLQNILGEDITNVSLEILENRSDLGQLYGAWVIDNSGTKLDDIGIAILAKELGRTIITRPLIDSQKNLPYFFDPVESTDADPIFLVNNGGHWDLAHLSKEGIVNLLEKRMREQLESFCSLIEGDAQGRQQAQLIRCVQDYGSRR